MSEIKRYYPSDIQLNSGRSRVLLTEHLVGQLCKYEDVAPVIQRNKELAQRNAELEAEIKQLREQEPVCHVSGFDRVWWNDKFISPDEVPKMNTPLYVNQKPAQELPSKLIEWVNSWQEDDSDMPSYLIGCNDMKHFVKSQLDKMKGKQ
jgi:hypothetical protein